MKKSEFSKWNLYREGFKDGIPIALGYFAVSFSLGIAARNAGLNPIQGFAASLLTLASAGEYAGFTVIAQAGGYLQMMLMTIVASARYLLMSCALSQKAGENTSLIHRIGTSFFLTDEIFGITIGRPGKLEPYYTYGAGSIAAPSWALGTALGIIVGNIMPARIVSALSVALYGMFIAVIIPPTRTSKVISAIVAISFAASWLFTVLPVISSLSGGSRIIILTLLLSSGAAILCPVKEAENE